MGARLDEQGWAFPLRWAAGTVLLFLIGWLLDDEPQADVGGDQ